MKLPSTITIERIEDSLSRRNSQRPLPPLASVFIDGYEIYCLRHPGQSCRLRTHEPAFVLGLVLASRSTPLFTSYWERIEEGHPFLYRVRLENGGEEIVSEDELVGSEFEVGGE